MSVFDRFMPGSTEYMAKLRAGEVLRFDVNPFPEVWKMRENVYSMLAKSPGMGGDAWMHLVIGPEKAILIDTGFGIGDLKGLVETLTDKPCFVVNTHFHGDHSMGNYQFDKVYCHKYDVPELKKQLDPATRERFAPSEGAYYNKEDLVPTKDYEIIGVEHGHIFDLGGGHTLELFHLPGHAAGGCGLIDNKNRILFSGDAIVYTPTMISGGFRGSDFPEYLTVTAFRDRLSQLVERVDEFDVLYPGHSCLDFSRQSVEDMLNLCKAIIAEPNVFDDEDITMGDMRARLKIVGLASIAYSPERI